MKTNKKQTSKEKQKLEEKLRTCSGKILDIVIENLEWSPQARLLKEVVEKVGINAPEVNRQDYILAFFTELSMTNKQIQIIDTQFLSIQNLLILNLSFNTIEVVDNLPLRLQELNIYGNLIREFRNQPIQSLIHIGAGFNLIEEIGDFQKQFPNLICLDLTYNNITQVEPLVNQIQYLGKLKMLYLAGNPITFYDNYFQHFQQYLVQIVFLDGIQIASTGSSSVHTSFEGSKSKILNEKNMVQQQQSLSKTKIPAKEEVKRQSRIFTNDTKSQLNQTKRSNFEDNQNVTQYIMQVEISTAGKLKPETKYQVKFNFLNQLLETEEKTTEEKPIVDFKAKFEIPIEINVEFRDQIRKGIFYEMFKNGNLDGMINLDLQH